LVKYTDFSDIADSVAEFEKKRQKKKIEERPAVLLVISLMVLTVNSNNTVEVDSNTYNNLVMRNEAFVSFVQTLPTTHKKRFMKDLTDDQKKLLMHLSLLISFC
jgi:hypothetical protein